MKDLNTQVENIRDVVIDAYGMPKMNKNQEYFVYVCEKKEMPRENEWLRKKEES